MESINIMEGYHPSGCALPHILKKRKNHKKSGISSIGNPGGVGSDAKSAATADSVRRSSVKSDGKSSNDLALYSDEVKCLSNMLDRGEAILSEIQRQLIVGEEAYYEETYHHGNIFRGFDGFLDLKLNSNGNGSQGQVPVVNVTKRKMPMDDRFFSGSCVHVKAGTVPYDPPPLVVSSSIRSSSSAKQKSDQKYSTIPLITSSSSVAQSNAHLGVSNSTEKSAAVVLPDAVVSSAVSGNKRIRRNKSS